MTVLSPLGFGLDESAIDAVSQWRFDPGMKDGKAVKIAATVEVRFRFAGAYFDARAERRRTQFNDIVSHLKQQKEGKATPQQVETIQKLAAEKFGPAEYALGTWKLSGQNVIKDETQGLQLIMKAADANYAPAMFLVGKLKMTGQLLPKDSEAGLKLIKDAAILGNDDAQWLLGNKYEAGDGVEQNLERARGYFRLCAASGMAECQLRLAKLLLHAPDCNERTTLEAIAWLELAAEHGLKEAHRVAEAERQNLNDEQIKWVVKLKRQFGQKRI